MEDTYYDGKLNLIQKLAKIRAISDVAVKNKRGFNFTYADITSVLAKVTAGMKKYGVSLIPSIVPGTTTVTKNEIVKTKIDKTGKPFDQTTTEMLVNAGMEFKWVNDENPDESLIVPWFITGSQEDPSQAFGSGLTYCTRYFLTNFFQIAQPDTDADEYRRRQKEAEESENVAISAEIIEQFDTEIKRYMSDNPGRTEDVKALVSKYVKNMNYKSIKNPELATKLLNEFRGKFITEE